MSVGSCASTVLGSLGEFALPILIEQRINIKEANRNYDYGYRRIIIN